MPTHARTPLIKISPQAKTIYKMMIEGMDNSGFLNFDVCLEISAAGTKMKGDVTLDQCLRELQEASLVFSLADRAGWMVRFPVVQF